MASHNFKIPAFKFHYIMSSNLLFHILKSQANLLIKTSLFSFPSKYRDLQFGIKEGYLHPQLC